MTKNPSNFRASLHCSGAGLATVIALSGATVFGLAGCGSGASNEDGGSAEMSAAAMAAPTIGVSSPTARSSGADGSSSRIQGLFRQAMTEADTTKIGRAHV